MPTRYDLDEHGKIRPDPEDFDAVRETPDDPLKSCIQVPACPGPKVDQALRIGPAADRVNERDGKTGRAKPRRVIPPLTIEPPRRGAGLPREASGTIRKDDGVAQLAQTE